MVTAILYDHIKSAPAHLKEQEQLPGGNFKFLCKLTGEQAHTDISYFTLVMFHNRIYNIQISTLWKFVIWLQQTKWHLCSKNINRISYSKIFQYFFDVFFFDICFWLNVHLIFCLIRCFVHSISCRFDELTFWCFVFWCFVTDPNLSF